MKYERYVDVTNLVGAPTKSEHDMTDNNSISLRNQGTNVKELTRFHADDDRLPQQICRCESLDAGRKDVDRRGWTTVTYDYYEKEMRTKIS